MYRLENLNFMQYWIHAQVHNGALFAYYHKGFLKIKCSSSLQIKVSTC